MEDLKIRDQKFREDVNRFTEYTEGMRDHFIDYWGEPGKLKMRWEMERTWDLKRRLKRWMERQKIYDNERKSKSITEQRSDAFTSVLNKGRAEYNAALRKANN